MRAGSRLQRHAGQARDLGERFGQADHELERALDGLVGLVRVQARRSPRDAAASSLMRGLYFIVQLPSG